MTNGVRQANKAYQPGDCCARQLFIRSHLDHFKSPHPKFAPSIGEYCLHLWAADDCLVPSNYKCCCSSLTSTPVTAFTHQTTNAVHEGAWRSLLPADVL
jgi:hypothetical protein